jgi:hypothetical protein
MNIGTWNMQGKGTEGDVVNKWTSHMPSLLQGSGYPPRPPLDVCCLQEAGTSPAGAEVAPGLSTCTWENSGITWYITFYAWVSQSLSSSGEPNRCSLAVISRTKPENTAVVPRRSEWRPMLFCLFDGLWIGSIHCISGGGPDGPGLVKQASTYFGWDKKIFIAGDFNRSPEALFEKLQIDVKIIPPNGPTHFSGAAGHRLDYAVTNLQDGASPDIGTVTGIASDHSAVVFAGVRTPGGAGTGRTGLTWEPCSGPARPAKRRRTGSGNAPPAASGAGGAAAGAGGGHG